MEIQGQREPIFSSLEIRIYVDGSIKCVQYMIMFTTSLHGRVSIANITFDQLPSVRATYAIKFLISVEYVRDITSKEVCKFSFCIAINDPQANASKSLPNSNRSSCYTQNIPLSRENSRPQKSDRLYEFIYLKMRSQL